MSEKKHMVPKLRFPGFTGDWERRKLGDVIDRFEYGLNAAATEYDGVHKYIRITDIDDVSHKFLKSNLTTPKIDFQDADTEMYKLKEGDILFARTGASVGKTYLYDINDGDLYFAGFLIRGHVNPSNNAKFVYQNTLTENYDSFIKITSQRSGQPGVNSKEYAEFKLYIPSKEEQEKISLVLTDFDNLIILHQRKLESLKLKKKALLQKLFPKNGEQFPELRFPGFTDAWEQRKFTYLLDKKEGIRRGPFGSALKKSSFVKESKYTVYEQQNAIYDRFDTRYHITKEKFDELYKFQLTPGDFIMSGAGTIGRIARVPNGIKTGVFNQALIRFKIDETLVDSEYFLEWIRSEGMQKEFTKATPGSAMVNLVPMSEVKEWEVLLPTKDEQYKIGSLLSKISNLITLHQRKLEHLQLQKKALLQQMFV